MIEIKDSASLYAICSHVIMVRLISCYKQRYWIP